MYNWKINMKNGDKFIVKSEIANTQKFMHRLLGEHSQAITTTDWILVKDKTYKHGDNFEESFVSNCVVIVNQDVSSVEFITSGING